MQMTKGHELCISIGPKSEKIWKLFFSKYKLIINKESIVLGSFLYEGNFKGV